MHISVELAVPARWLLGDHQVHGLEAARSVERGGPVPVAEARLFAEDDITDLLASDAVVSFTEPPRSAASRGGRHVEFGYALGLFKPICVIGPKENIFHYNLLVAHFESLEVFLATH